MIRPTFAGYIRHPNAHLWCVFLFVTAAQLWFVSHLGNDIPLWDQWGAEGSFLYPRWLASDLTASDLLMPHSEHRILWTRLLDLVLFATNGAWDPLVQLGAGILLRAGAAALLTRALTAEVPARDGWILGFATVALYLPVLAWENVLSGFQSQVFFALALVAAGFGKLARSTDDAWSRSIGYSLLAMAQLAMGPGLVAAPAVVVWLCLRRYAGHRPTTVDWIASILLLVEMGWCWTPEPRHAALEADSALETAVAFVRIMSWPHIGVPPAFAVLVAPLAWLLLSGLRKQTGRIAGESAAAMLGVWSAGVAAALALSRGAHDAFSVVMPSRYIDFLVVSHLSAFAALLALRRRHPRIGRFSANTVAWVWTAFLAVGLTAVSSETIKWVLMPRWRDPEAAVARAIRFQHTGDVSIFNGVPRILLPTPDLDAMAEVLHDPRLAGRMPPSFQPELPPGPLGRLTRLVMRHATAISLILALPAVVIALASLQSMRPRQDEPADGP